MVEKGDSKMKENITAVRMQCSYAEDYQAKRAPTCGCVLCWIKWECYGLKITASWDGPNLELSQKESVVE